MSKITNTEVFGLERAIRTAKYPKAVNLEKLNSELTPGIKACLTCETGMGHDNALNGVVVTFDLTFPIKAWVEIQRYHFMDFISSQSTMHKTANFDLDAQFNRYVDPVIAQRVKEIRAAYLANPAPENYLKLLYNLPTGFEYTAGMVTNYRQLKTIYQQRRTHRLPDWQMFCDWIESLPMSFLITGNGEPDSD